MGGLNSGRFGRRSHTLLDVDATRVRMCDLVRAGVSFKTAQVAPVVAIELDGNDDAALRVRLLLTEQPVAVLAPQARLSDASMIVQLAASSPNFGGQRLWFVCPRSACGRRCVVLYRPRSCNARAFACRRCHGVRYLSQRISPSRRAERRAESCVRRLVRNAEGDFQRPRGMHRATYTRLIGERVRFVNLAWATSSLASTSANAMEASGGLTPSGSRSHPQ